MIFIIRFAVICSILFAFGICEGGEQNKNKKYLMVPIRVRREPPDTVEFQFNKTVQIEPISLKANEVNFQLSEENNVKKFRNSIPFHQGESQAIKINLEYREPGKAERKFKPFQHAFRQTLDEVITVQIEISLPKSRDETPLESDGSDTIVQPNRENEREDLSNDGTHRMKNKIIDDEDDFDDSCEENEAYADKLLATALRLGSFGTHLMLKGYENTSANPVDTIREILDTQYDLPQLEYKILQAKFVNEGLLFEMQTPRDAVEILAKRDSVDANDHKIEPTDKTIFDTNTLIDIRSDI